VICDRALLGAYTAEQSQVTPKLVREAASEVGGGPPPAPAWRSRTTLAGAVLAAVALMIAIGWWGLADPLVEATAPAEALPAASVDAVVPAATAAGTARAELASTTPSLEPALPAPVPVQAIGEWLRGVAADAGTDAAFATLLELWELAPPGPGTQPCRYVTGHGLRCEHQLGSWTLLRAFNRPAILDLVDSTGSSHQVVVTALDDAHATVRAGSESRVVALGEIDRYWFGEFLLLWRPYPGAETLMLPGTRSEGVRWLRGALVGLQGGADPSGDLAHYDDALIERVRTFQREQGLKADGKAGLQTLIALSTVLNQAGTPLLRNGGG
jgi:general secretion pathway protein A